MIPALPPLRQAFLFCILARMTVTNHPHNIESFHSTILFDRARIHAAAIYCSDGRFGEQMDQFLQEALRLPRYDRLAIPGGPACLAGHSAAFRQQQGLLEDLKFLVSVHRLERVILIGHQNCAFYLDHLHVHEIELLRHQCDDLQKAADRVREVDPSLEVESYFAALNGDTVRFRSLETLRDQVAGG